MIKSWSRARALFGLALAGTVVSAAGLVGSIVAALPAGTPPTNGLSGLVLSPDSGDSGSTFSMQFNPLNQECPGNNNTGWFWSTFITPIDQDPALLTFSASGQPVATSLGRTTAFRDPADELVRNRFPDLDTFAITPPNALSWDTTFSRNPDLPAGDYYVGIACFNSSDLMNAKYWATQIEVTASEGSGPHGFTWTVDAGSDSTTTSSTTTSTTTTTTTIPDDGTTTTTTTVAGGTTTSTVAGNTTSTSVAGGSTSATVTPSSPTPGGAFSVAFPNCTVGETITFRQSASTPSSVTDVCEASSALTSGSIAGIRRLDQATTGTATGNFSAAPTAPGSYTVTMTGTASAQRTVTFVIVGPSTPVTGGGSTNANTGGSPTSSSTGTIPSTGSSTTALIVWGVLLLVFGRMAILLGRKPKVLTGT